MCIKSNFGKLLGWCSRTNPVCLHLQMQCIVFLCNYTCLHNTCLVQNASVTSSFSVILLTIVGISRTFAPWGECITSHVRKNVTLCFIYHRSSFNVEVHDCGPTVVVTLVTPNCNIESVIFEYKIINLSDLSESFQCDNHFWISQPLCWICSDKVICQPWGLVYITT